MQKAAIHNDFKYFLLTLLIGGLVSHMVPVWAAPEQLPSSTKIEASPVPEPNFAERTLSLQACFDQAATYNKETIAARYNLPVAKAAIKIAGAIPNPKFSLLYGFGPSYTIIIAGNPQQFGWQQQIQTAGKRTKKIELAKASYDVVAFQIAALMFDVHNRTRRAYAEQAAAEAYVELIESERKVSSELVNIAQKRFDAGKSSMADVLQAQLGVMQFDTQISLAQTRLQTASARLSLLIGEIPTQVEIIDVTDNGIFQLATTKTDLVPSVEKALPALEDLFPAAYKERKDLRVTIQQAYADRKALTVARAKRIPDLFIDSGYQFTSFLHQQPYGLFAGRVNNQSGCYLNANSEFPVFYQYQGEIDQVKNTWYQDFDQTRILEWQIASDLVTSYESVVVAKANIGKYQKELIPLASQVAKAARRSYQVGKTDLANAILAKQQYQQVLSSYFDAVVAYQNAWADLEKSMGVPLKL